MSVVQRRHRVRQRRRRPPQAKCQPRDLTASALDQQRLAASTYLTVDEVCVYGKFKTKNAAYKALATLGVAIIVGRVSRREFDLAMDRRASELKRKHAA